LNNLKRPSASIPRSIKAGLMEAGGLLRRLEEKSYGGCSSTAGGNCRQRRQPAWSHLCSQWDPTRHCGYPDIERDCSCHQSRERECPPKREGILKQIQQLTIDRVNWSRPSWTCPA